MNREQGQVSCVVALVALLAAQVYGESVGWNGDQSANFPEATPPVNFDGATGVNMRWKTAIPNWGNSSPIVVDVASLPEGGQASGKGQEGRVLCVSEPDEDYAPLLICYDADNGAEQWRVRLDAVPLLPLSDEEKEEVRALAMENSRRLRAVKRLTVEAGLLLAKHKDALSEVEKNVPVPEEIQEEFAPLVEDAHKHDLLRLKEGEQVDPRTFARKLRKPKEFVGQRRLSSLALRPSTWEGTAGTWEGVAYPTPVSDGKHVYTMTAHNLYSCHDLSGNVVWQKRFPLPSKDDLREGDEARIERFGQKRELGGKWGGWTTEHFQTSPVLYEGKLITSGGRVLRCFDAATGDLLWHVPMAGAMRHTMGVPAVVDVEGTPCVIMVCDTWNTAAQEIVRLADGVVVGEIPGTRWGFNGSIPVLSDGTIVRNVPEKGKGQQWARAGFRLSLGADGKVVANEVWRIPPGGLRSGVSRGAWRGTRYYGAGGVCIDGSTGEILFDGIRGVFGGGSYDGQALLIGPYYVMCRFYAGGLSFRDADTAALIAGSTVPVAPEDGRGPSEVGAQALVPDWKWLGPATPFAHGDRLYVRANDFLYCFAPDVNGTLDDDPGVVAAIRNATKSEDIVKYLESDSAQYRYETVSRLVDLLKPNNQQPSTINHLRRLAAEDPYVEIRAEALKVLGLDADQPGRDLLHTLLEQAGKKPWQHRNKLDSPLRSLGLLVRHLGDTGIAPLEQILAEADPRLQETAAALVWYGDVPCTDAMGESLAKLKGVRGVNQQLIEQILTRRGAE